MQLRSKLVDFLRHFKLLPLAKLIYGRIAYFLPPSAPKQKGPLASLTLMHEVHQALNQEEQTQSIIFLSKL